MTDVTIRDVLSQSTLEEQKKMAEKTTEGSLEKLLAAVGMELNSNGEAIFTEMDTSCYDF